MTMPGGAQYLPPIVTRLLGDASDLLAAFAEAKAAQEAFTKSSMTMADKVKSSTKTSGRDVDEFTDLVVRKMHAGESAVDVLRRRLRDMGDEVTTIRKRMSVEGANQGLFHDFERASGELTRLRNLARTIAPDLLNAGEKSGKGFLTGFIGGMSGIGEVLMPLLIGAIVLALPAIGALIGSAVVVGLGLGFAGIGTILAAVLLPKVQKSFATIGVTAKRAFKSAVSGGFDDGLLQALSIFNRWIPIFGKQFRGIFDSLGPVMPKLANALGAGIQDLITGIATAIKQITENGSLQTFIDTIPMVMQSIGQFFAEITKDGPALSRFIADAAYAIVGFIDGLGKVISFLTRTYNWVVKINDKFPFIGWTKNLQMLQRILGIVGDFFVDLWGKITSGGASVGGWFANLGKTIWKWLTSTAKGVADWVMGVVGWFQKLPGRILRYVEAIPGRMIAAIKQAAHTTAYLFGWMVGRWVGFLLSAPGKILAVIERIWAWTTRKTQEGVTAVVNFVAALPERIVGFFVGLYTAVTSWSGRMWTSIINWFIRIRTGMVMWIVRAIDAVIGFFKGLPGRATTELKSFKDRVLKFFSDANKWLIEAGKDIVRGIVDGVSSLWDWAVGKVKSFAHDILRGFKDALGISSPSKLFAQAGANSALGYMQGWKDMIGKARDAVSGRQTLHTVLTYPTGGNPRPAAPALPGDPRGGGMTQTVLYLDGKRFATAITPASQRRGSRNGITGTGLPTTRIM